MSKGKFVLRLIFFTAVALGIFAGASGSMSLYRDYRADRIAAEPLGATAERLKQIQPRLGTPVAGSWLAEQFERGQTFSEYQSLLPRRPVPDRNTIFILPLGKLSDPGMRILELAREYLSAYFCLPGSILDPVPAAIMESSGNPRSRSDGTVQFHTEQLLKRAIAPRVPKNSFLLIGLTEADLYPRDTWNFVFGQAMPEAQIGIWSINRFGLPGESPAAFRETLRRTLRTASHELSHLLGIPHCITYACNLNGSMSLDESDEHPLEACPSCLHKIIWNTGCDLNARLKLLAEFAAGNGLHGDSARFRAELEAIS